MSLEVLLSVYFIQYSEKGDTKDYNKSLSGYVWAANKYF